jgi:mono/diheme cytochrome c family protein
MKRPMWFAGLAFIGVLLLSGLLMADREDRDEQLKGNDAAVRDHAAKLVRDGRRIFRSDTFGSEAFWGGALRLHQTIAGTAGGGAGPGLSPRAALSLGLKVDSDALPQDLVNAVTRGAVSLDDPATTVALLKLDAVVGVKGFFGQDGKLTSVGIQCALCHSTVDNSFSTNAIPPGNIGKRLDGWPARDLNVGAIIASAPTVKPFADLLETDEATVRKALLSWGPGKFDAELVLDGKAFRPDGKSAATLLPAAFGLAGISQHTYTGWGGIPHWNAFVANLEMSGSGTFWDPRLNDAARFPIAAKAGFGNRRPEKDLVTGKLAALHAYQVAIPAPKLEKSPFDYTTRNGEQLFNGKARCAVCHVPPLYTEPGWNMHKPEEIGIDSFQAERSPDGRYRTTPLSGMIARQKGGFYHDGRFATLLEVVNHYDRHFNLRLSETEKRDLVAFVSSL